MTEQPEPQAQAPSMDEASQVSLQPGKLLRIGTMVRQMLDEVRRAPLDEGGRKRLREVYDRSMDELKQVLSPELCEELSGISIPFGEDVPSESELRIAQAQLVGWLEGLFHGIQAALWAQHVQAQQQIGELRKGLPDGKGPGQYL